ncbi:MAG: 4Fe-4S dicluster domain-containing protein [Acidobacteriota bacterium]
MITIAIDDKACVGCALCADICPTKVFVFDEVKSQPVVVKPKECFGCLSCSEICPATAIHHDGVTLSAAFHHDPYAMALASKLLTNGKPIANVPADREIREHAMSDLGVRLLSIASVFKQTLGSGLPAVGSIAGRTLANQLPRYRVPKTMGEALALAKEQFGPAWCMEPSMPSGEQLLFEIKDCFVRELCKKEGIELGGELCVLFCNYLTGYLGSTSKTRLRLTKADRGAERCVYDVKIYQ